MIAGNAATIAGVGTATITATQAANGNYASANISANVTVTAATPSLGAFTLPGQANGLLTIPYAPNFTVLLPQPTSASAGAWTYVSSDSSVIVIAGNAATIAGVGTTTITATQAANGNYASASILANVMVTAPIPVSTPTPTPPPHPTPTPTPIPTPPSNQLPQTIRPFATIPSKSFGTTFTITPPRSSVSLPVTVSVKSGPASISGNMVTVTGVGTVVLAADQAGNANYATAPQVTTQFISTQASQTISAFQGIQSTQRPGNSIQVTTPLATSGLPVNWFVKSGPATLTGNILKFTDGERGTVILQATQSGNANYLAATTVTKKITVK